MHIRENLDRPIVLVGMMGCGKESYWRKPFASIWC